MSYVTKSEIKQYGGINWDAGVDTFVDTLIASAEDYVERFCGNKVFSKRSFEAPSPDDDVTKYFNGSGEQKLYIGDLREITSLTVDGVALTKDEDYYLYPLNAEADGEPFEWIELIQPETSFSNTNPRRTGIPYIFEDLQRSVTVVGKWGYSETPPEDVKVAVMKIVLGFIKENIGDNDLREVTSETIGEYSVSYAKIKDTADRTGVDHLLKPYKRKSRKPVGRIVQI
jgi:hypothetical protein